MVDLPVSEWLWLRWGEGKAAISRAERNGYRQWAMVALSELPDDLVVVNDAEGGVVYARADSH